LALDGWIRRILKLPTEIAANQQALAWEIQRTADLMSALFVAPHLPVIAVVFTEAGRRGGYHPQTESIARHISMSRLGASPRLTFAHEFGHYLDDALGGFETYYSHLEGPLISGVMRAIERTDAVMWLRASELATRGRLTLARHETLRLLDSTELWARAYAQYVALRSGDSVLVKEIGQRRNDADEPFAAQEYWTDEDFTSVGVEIDGMLRGLEWLL
jgi:hypothetical protein